LLYVEHNPHFAQKGRHYLPEGREQARENKTHLEAFAKQQFPGLSVAMQVMQGDPAAKIIECATAEDGNLIMMPTRGCGPYRRFLLGSVTAKVLHDCDCPVWTSVHLEQPTGANPVCRKIACAVDLGPHTTRVLSWASGLAAAMGTRLLIIHAAAPVDPMVAEVSAPDARTELVNQAREEIEGLMRQLKIEADVEIGSGSVSEFVYGHAARFAADLLVIGRHEARGIAGRLHPHAYAIIRDSLCPVISI
jgi:nucleotide-binding universal stress UspA family protein